jgi:hypothetical protein
MILLLAILPAIAGECPEQPLTAALGWASTLETAYASIDEARLEQAHKGLRDAVPCIRAELGPNQAFEIHRALALGAFFDGNESQSRESWAAVRALQPNWTPPASLMPEGHPLLSLWRATETTPSSMIPLQEAPRGGWGVDGTRQNGIPAARAFILQGFDGSGAVVHTGYLYDPAELPKLEGIEMVPTKRIVAPSGKAPVDHDARSAAMHKWGTVAAGTVGGAALASLGLAVASNIELARIDEQNDPSLNGRAAVLLQRSSAASLAAVALGATSAVTATVVWTVRW